MSEALYNMEQHHQVNPIVNGISNADALLSNQLTLSQQIHNTSSMQDHTHTEHMSEHKRKFMEEIHVSKENFRKIPTIEKYNKMIVALKLKNDMDSGRLAIDSKGLGKQLDAMGIDRSRFYDWNKKFLYIEWPYGHGVVERKENKEDMTKLENLRRFVHVEELFEIIEAQHADTMKKSKKHNGIKRTYDKCLERYCNVTRTACDIYCAHCDDCLGWGKERKPRPPPVPRAKNPPQRKQRNGKRTKKNTDGSSKSKRRRPDTDSAGFPLMAGDVVGSGNMPMGGNPMMMAVDGSNQLMGVMSGNVMGSIPNANMMHGGPMMHPNMAAGMGMPSNPASNSLSMDTVRITAKMSGDVGSDSEDEP